MNDESMMELDGGDFEPVPQVAGIESIETESQSHKGSIERGKGAEKEAVGKPQTIKTPPKRDWDRRKVIDWESIKSAMIAGMRAEDAAKRWGSTAGSIGVRSHAEQWPTPDRIRKSAEKRIAEAQADLHRARMLRANGSKAQDESSGETGSGEGNNGNGGNEAMGSGEGGVIVDGSGGEWGLSASRTASKTGNLAVTALADDLVGMAESGTLQAARRALRSIKQAPESLPIRGASDLAILAKLLRSMAGLDSPQVAVNLEFFTSNQPDAASLGVVIDDCSMTDSD